MLYEEFGEMKLMIIKTILLFNFRTRVVGIIQIMENYIPN